MNNPYSWSTVNPNIFYGRDRLLGELMTYLPGSPRASFAIAGGRRMGKTTLLRRVEQELRAGMEQWRAGGLFIIPIYMDGHVLPKTPEGVWGYLLRQLQTWLPDLKAPPLADYAAFQETLSGMLSTLSERPRVVVMFDEVEGIIESSWGVDFFENWRAFLSNTPEMSEYVTAVFAGARDLEALSNDITSPLKDILEWRSLRLLDSEDAYALMQEPIDTQWPLSFLQAAYRETGGHPMLIQYIMQTICEQHPAVPEESLRLAVKRFLDERSWQFESWWTRYCTPLAQLVYARLPDSGETIPKYMLVEEFGSRVNDALEVLQHVGIIASEDDGFQLRFAGEMFRRWYRLNGSLLEDSKHDLEVHRRLQTVNPNLAGKYLSAWRIYEEHLPNYSGVLVELRGVLELLVDNRAPREQVIASSWFKPEPGNTEPTLRQRIRYMALRQYDNERSKELIHDYNLLETQCDQLAQLATKAARTASGMVHDFASREQAYRALKQWDGILIQLLPLNPELIG